MTPLSRKALIVAAAIAAAAVGVWVYAAFDPMATRWFPRCTFKLLTGLDCPGCGTQRAIHALAHGRLAQAWGYNAAFVVSLPLMAFIVIGQCQPALRRAINSRPFILAIFFLLLAWWIGRNIL
ncbi:MAG: DUF2752 domain-containing protein [Pseudoflavonifractor sp.]|nr:DUF2752 domain-containing protein [Alloprevotella sp.]MCM1116959.1 DUF2752 domain-containing protein [Pseudoflavonifractor sp.]